VKRAVGISVAEEGRLDHRDRQREYRVRLAKRRGGNGPRVTDKGSADRGPQCTLPSAPPFNAAQEERDEKQSEQEHGPRCVGCGRHGRFVRWHLCRTDLIAVGSG
jgi:hypothetical protein